MINFEHFNKRKSYKRILMIHTSAIGVKAYSKNPKVDYGDRAFTGKVPGVDVSKYNTYGEAVLDNQGWAVCYDTHMNLNKWKGGVGYHAVMERDGTLKETDKGRGALRANACLFTTPEYGSMQLAAYHICISGNGDHEKLTSEQRDTLVEFLEVNKDNFDEFVWHKDFTKKAKSCPGNVLIHELVEIANKVKPKG